MGYVRGRYSWLLRPILIVYDLIVINMLAYYMLDFNDEDLYFFAVDFLNNKYLIYAVYSIICWMTTAFILSFYKVYRYTSIFNIFSLLFKQFLIYTVIVYAFVGVFRSINLSAFVTLNYLLNTFFLIGFLKILSYYVLKAVRKYLKGNQRNVIIVGSGKSVNDILGEFSRRKELGYNIKGVFANTEGDNFNGSINDAFSFLKNNSNIDEIYCAIDELRENQVNDFVKYADMQHCNIKFIPSTNRFFEKRLHIDYYSYLPILSIQEVALNNYLNKLIKRSFDIIFSLIIIIFVLSWLSVILFIIIKLESRGPLFYKHKRNGINYKEFYCFKYRSLSITKEIKGTYVKQNDNRVTRVGKFLRKTSIDELPQFINVLLGDMSVVGPRPHMLSYTKEYSKIIDKYNFIFRHNVKPGITGLAQVKGYRGEIETDKDIINRIKYDIFYIENWSLFLDVRIIVRTIIKFLTGDKKAY